MVIKTSRMWKLLTMRFMVLIIFAIVSIAYSARIEAENSLSSQEYEIDYLLQNAQRVSFEFLNDINQTGNKNFQENKPELTSIAKNQVCQSCHNSPPLNVRPEAEDASTPSSPTQRVFEISSNMFSVKSSLEHYLSLSDASLENKIKFLKRYILSVHDYFLISLITSRENSFDYIDQDYGFPLPTDFMTAFQNELSSDHMIPEERLFFIKMIRMNYGKLQFSSEFKVNVEVASYLFEQTQDSWFNFIKLQASYYFSKQLVALSDYWPEMPVQNHYFFAMLSQHFRSLKTHFDSLLEKNGRQQKQFNLDFSKYLNKQPIPTILTRDRYRTILDYAPKRKEILDSTLDEFLKNTDPFEYEQHITQTEIGRKIRNDPYALNHLALATLAQWTQSEILKIKKEFLHKYLIESFVDSRDMDNTTASTVEDILYRDYEKELTFATVFAWIFNFQSSSGAIESSRLFQSLALDDILKATGIITRFDEWIQAYLLHDFNASLSWSVDALKKVGCYYDQTQFLKSRWSFSGMKEEEMNSVLPPNDEASQNIISILPKENFPNPRPIPYQLINGLLLDIMRSLPAEVHILAQKNNVTRSLFDSQEVKKLTKEELIQKFRQLTSDVESLFHTPYIYQRDSKAHEEIHHEKEKLHTALESLKELLKRLEKLNPENKDTLDEFFENRNEKVTFLKHERQRFIDQYRILNVSVFFDGQTKPLLDHLKDLETQDGLLTNDILDFLSEQKDHISEFYRSASALPFVVPNLSSTFDYRPGTFISYYQEKTSELLPSEDRNKLLDENTKIVLELRTLKKCIEASDVPFIAFYHPQYFLGAKEHVIRPKTLEYLQRIQDLRKQREMEYLSHGGRILDTWLKTYIVDLLVRQALIEQDLVIRKNIYTVVMARSIEDIKTIITDPFIIEEAAKTLSDMQASIQDANQDSKSMDLDLSWRLEDFRKTHEDIQKQFTNGFLESYFSSHTRQVLWGTALVFLLASSGGTAAPWVAWAAFGLNTAVTADFTAAVGYHGYELYYDAPALYQTYQDLYLSSAIPETGGPGGSSEDLRQFREGMTSQRFFFWGLEVPMLALGYRMDWQLYHSNVNIFIKQKTASYAKYLGLTSEEITPEMIQLRTAEKLAISTEKLSTLPFPEFEANAIRKLGRKEGKWIAQIYKFFTHVPIQTALQQQTLNRLFQALQTLEVNPEINTNLLEAAEMRANAIMNDTIIQTGHASISAEFDQLMYQRRQSIRDALEFLKSNPEMLRILEKAYHL